MELKLIATFLTAVFFVYMVLTDRMAGTTFSISNSWYAWQKKNYSSAFIIFLSCIGLGLLLVSHYHNPKHPVSFNLLLIGGGFSAYAIGIAANFKQGWRESMYHNIFSAATFASVLIAFFIEGVQFPLYSFVMINGVFLLIDVGEKKTTIIEVVGIALAIMGVFYL